jgi:glycosyltransferase involved in cell wall biosynthesis
MITPYYYPVIGGITSFVGKLVGGLSKKGVSVSILTGDGEPSENVDVIGLRRFSFIIRSFRLIRKKKPEVIHTHAHWYIMIPTVFYKIFHSETVIVHTFHTDPKKIVKGLKRRFLAYLLSKYDHVTFVSRALMESYVRDFCIDFKSMSVVYAGVSIPNPTIEEQRTFIDSHNLKGRYPILCFMGPLMWNLKVEGVRRLVSAFEIVNKSLPSSTLLIVGDGEFRNELEGTVNKKGLKNNVVFTGFLTEPQIPLSIVDIYTHISLQEGQSIAILEAMALGRPVVASKTGGIPEVIEDGKNGLLVDSEPKIIAQRIIELAGNKELMGKLGENAQKTVMDDFDWEDATEEFMNVYKKVNVS